MKRALILAAALATLAGFALPARQAQAAVSVGFSLGTGRHGGFSLAFASRPNVVLIPSSRVYYAPDLDEDLYAYDGEWYYCDDGSWYVADSYDGPFIAVAFESVPYEIRCVPAHYRRHWGAYSDSYGSSGYWGSSRYSAPTYRYRSTYRAPVVTYPYRDRNQVWNDDRNRTSQTWSGYRNQGNNDRNRTSQTWSGYQNQGNDDDRGNGQGNRGNGRGRGHGHGRWGR